MINISFFLFIVFIFTTAISELSVDYVVIPFSWKNILFWVLAVLHWSILNLLFSNGNLCTIFSLKHELEGNNSFIHFSFHDRSQYFKQSKTFQVLNSIFSRPHTQRGSDILRSAIPHLNTQPNPQFSVSYCRGLRSRDERFPLFKKIIRLFIRCFTHKIFIIIRIWVCPLTIH